MNARPILLISMIGFSLFSAASGRSNSKRYSGAKERVSVEHRRHREAANSNNTTRQQRTFFQVIQFSNGLCRPRDYGEHTGICYTESECRRLGGQPNGQCASGFGVCCFFLFANCGNSSSANHTYWSNPGGNIGYDATSTCLFTVHKNNPNICQIRLDLEVFDVRRPMKGDCVDDRFTVSGQNINSYFPVLCGINNKQHGYLDVSDSNGPIILNFATIGSYKRRWLIKVSHIECHSQNMAPSGCLQYFRGSTGIIESFNYHETGENSRGNKKGYLNNLDYSICFRKEISSCSITLMKDPSNPAQFHVDATVTAAAVGYQECPNDYLVFNHLRLCGIHINDSFDDNPPRSAAVKDSSHGPYVARFVSDEKKTHRGFQLMFRQNPCGNGK